MPRTIKVLISGDKSVSNTGFSTYKKKLLAALHEDDRFEVREHAWAGTKTEKSLVPWHYYPCVPSQTDKDGEIYAKNPVVNKNGVYRWERTLLHFKPDIVLSVQDPWQIQYQACSFLKPYYRLALGAPVDSAPQKTEYIDIYSRADMIVPYTHYGKQILNRQGIFTQSPIPMGIDHDVFYPLTSKEDAKGRLGIPKDSIVFGFVARNQPRKRIPELCQAFRRYLNSVNKRTADKSFLYLHTSYLDLHPWDLTRCIMENNLENKVLITYICQQTSNAYATFFKENTAHSPYSGEMSGTLIKPGISPSFDWLNIIYNSMDLYIQCATNEGFGSPLIEAAATGTPVVAIHHSTMGEVTKSFGGDTIQPPSEMEDPGVNAFRATVPIHELARYMADFAAGKIEQTGLREKVLELYNWKDSTDEWCERLVELYHDVPTKSWGDPPTQIVSQNIGGKITPSEFILKMNENMEDMYSFRTLKDLKTLLHGGFPGGGSWQTVTQHDMINKYNNYYKIIQELDAARADMNREEEEWQK